MGGKGGFFTGPPGDVGLNAAQPGLRSGIEIGALSLAAQRAREDRVLRGQLAESLIQERQAKMEADRRKQAQALFSQEVEYAAGAGAGGGTRAEPGTGGGGGGGGVSAEVAPFFGEARRMLQPGASVSKELPSGGMVSQPWVTGQDVQGAFRRGASQLRGATEAAAAALPASPEAEAVRGQVARGELRVPSAVGRAYKETLGTATEAQKLEQARALQGPEIATKKSEAEIKAEQAYQNRITSVYMQPLKDLEVQEKQATITEKGAQTTRAEIEGRKVAREIGERPLVPGSPQALKAEETRADLDSKRLAAAKARQELSEHQSYLAAVRKFQQTGDPRDLNAAILSSTGGAVSLANVIARGEQLDLEKSKELINQSGKLMASKMALQDHVNKKGDLPTAEGYARDINFINLRLSMLSGSPNVPWESVRMEEGMGGNLRRATVTLPREKALLLSNDMVQPTSPGDLKLLLAAHAGDLVNRAAGGDTSALQRLILYAQTYPGVTREASDAVVAELQQRLSTMTPTPEIRAQPTGGMPYAPVGIGTGGGGPMLRTPTIPSPAEKRVEKPPAKRERTLSDLILENPY